jgi:Deoxyribonuclease II
VPKKPPANPSQPASMARTVAPLAPLAIALLAGHVGLPSSAPAAGAPSASAGVTNITKTLGNAPVPLLTAGQPVDWWFVFKFNAGSFSGCSNGAQRACPFGGTVQSYSHFSQTFAYASSMDATLQKGGGCAGDGTSDPVGATFNQVYNGHYFYILWNDQFYGDPLNTEAAPAGHSKGMLAWDNDGNGLVLQVSTPSWPASGSSQNPRKTDGNSLGCIKDNDVLVSQHFFSLKLNKDDVIAVLNGLENASVVTDPSNPETVNNGGPSDVQAVVRTLGKLSTSSTATKVTLSSGVQLLSKPSKLEAPPWQMVSAMLGGEPLRVASWWTRPEIPSTTASTTVACWNPSLGKPGPVQIATSGTWAGTTIGLEGMAEPEGNHAKIGVSTGTHTYAIFGDMNQQGSLSGPNCGSSQNGRGGLFYVVDNATLAASVRDLIKGDSAPVQ